MEKMEGQPQKVMIYSLERWKKWKNSRKMLLRLFDVQKSKKEIAFRFLEREKEDHIIS